jgi:hypothetical protein
LYFKLTKSQLAGAQQIASNQKEAHTGNVRAELGNSTKEAQPARKGEAKALLCPILLTGIPEQEYQRCLQVQQKGPHPASVMRA